MLKFKVIIQKLYHTTKFKVYHFTLFSNLYEITSFYFSLQDCKEQISSDNFGKMFMSYTIHTSHSYTQQFIRIRYCLRDFNVIVAWHFGTFHTCLREYKKTFCCLTVLAQPVSQNVPILILRCVYILKSTPRSFKILGMTCACTVHTCCCFHYS